MIKKISDMKNVESKILVWDFENEYKKGTKFVCE
jgi:hypothetical protein